MKPAGSAGFAGDAGRASDGAGGRAVARPCGLSAGSLENADAADESAATSTNGARAPYDGFIRGVMAF